MTSLSEFCRGLDLPSSAEGPEFLFFADSVPVPPAKLSCDSLLITRGAHCYDGHSTVPVIHVQAPRETYRQLGVLLLATVFHRGCDVEIELTHKHATVKRLLIEKPEIMSWPSPYKVRPHSFAYWPDERTRHPWMNEGPENMPCLNFDEDPNGIVKATTVIDFSHDRGRVMLGELFLDIGCEGLPTDGCHTEGEPTDEYHLEGECGFRGAGPGSAEMSFWLPGSDAWDPDLWATAWPNGGGPILPVGDYYRVRFVEAHGPAVVGDEGIVVEHLQAASGICGCVVEVGPWSEHGAPRAVVTVDAPKLRKLLAEIDEDERRRISLREHTRDAFEGPRTYDA